jgi:hypothetical protein
MPERDYSSVCSRIALGSACLALVVVGCSKELPPPVDTNDAGRQLEAVLNAWKDGKPHDSLAAGDPPVIFTEPLWQDGTKLVAFQIGEVTLHGRQGRCTAKLTLLGKDGKQYERSIGYQIDTVPRVVIVREGLGP